jgi:hypothetical protein
VQLRHQLDFEALSKDLQLQYLLQSLPLLLLQYLLQ